MLKGTKNISLSFQSVVGPENKVAVYMTAQIPESGRSNSSKTIQDLDLYEEHKSECREDMDAFDEILWELEDQSAEPDDPGQAESGTDVGQETENSENTEVQGE